MCCYQREPNTNQVYMQFSKNQAIAMYQDTRNISFVSVSIRVLCVVFAIAKHITTLNTSTTMVLEVKNLIVRFPCNHYRNFAACFLFTV